jgi:hypothetical protein
MKIKGKKLKGEASGNMPMPNALRDKLNGLSVNQALAAGIIDDLGDEKGVLFFPHTDYPDRVYAIIQGYTVPASKALGDLNEDEAMEQIGDLRFQKGISTIEGDGFSKEFFRLGLPAYVNLDAAKAYGNVGEVVETV